ncbi:major facilitator superfamily domain-containing protein 10 isoform X2 [Bos javanicus]|uniref:major facilitator superfamily domain-containing protein 10 isoform X2 n=1 Tax=Bos javanicus TaxID=9906 RepID=UPI002AA85ECD|nr:major facilitator superfamily domain-containing protein 10 isoform X2 [Bos javanicus]
MPRPAPLGRPPGLAVSLRNSPTACVSCCPGSGAGRTERQPVTGQADPSGALWQPATRSAGPDRSRSHHGLWSRRELHAAPAHPPAAGTRNPRGRCGLPRPLAGPPGLHPAAAPTSRAAGEPRPCPRPPLRLLAARGGLVCSSHRDASGEEFLSAPLTGALSDCLGRRPGMLLSLAGVATSYAVWAASKSFAAFLASRVIGGISKGNVSLCTAIVADLGSPSARSKGMAVIGVAFSLGFTLGPTLGAFLPSDTVPWLALLFAVSDLLFIWCFLPETLPPEKRAPSVTLGFRAAADLLSPLALLRFSAVARGRDPPTGVRLGSLRGLGLVYFLYLFLFSGLEFTLSFLVHQRFRFSRVEQGKMFFFIGLTMATIQGAYARRIRPGREIAAVKQAILLLIPASLFVGWGHTLPILGLGLLLYSWASPWCPPSRSRRGPLPVLRGRRLWLARAEGHGHGHAAELGRPGQGRGARGGRLSVLAGRRPCLLHRVRGALPAPLLHPADPEPPGADTQGRVAGPPACDDVRMGGCA